MIKMIFCQKPIKIKTHYWLYFAQKMGLIVFNIKLDALKVVQGEVPKYDIVSYNMALSNIF